MTRQELIAKIARDTGISKVAAAAVLESFFEGLTRTLKAGETISFRGFGTFKTVQLKAPARRVVRFVPSFTIRP